MNIALVGGGKAAVAMLDHFQAFREHRIVGIADIRDDAPGLTRARELGIETTADLETLVRRPDVELVIEITGNAQVQESIRNLLRPGQDVVTASGARLMSDLIDAQARNGAEAAESISRTFTELTANLEHAAERIDSSFKTISRLLRETSVISINASIEAARAGAAGKPFEVVVHRIGEMVREIREAADGIGAASEETGSTLRELGQLEQRLTESFTTRTGGGARTP